MGSLVRDKQQYILAMDFSYILCLAIFGVVAAEKCPANVTDLPYTTYHDELGCVFADPYERFDNFDRAQMHCKNRLGDNAVLVEVLTEEHQNVVINVTKEAEKVMEDPELVWWWSSLRDVNDDGIWHWFYSNSTIDNYNNWNQVAVPNATNLDCMQFLSGTFFGAQCMTFECSNDFINTNPVCMLPNY